jgi:adenylate cyclase
VADVFISYAREDEAVARRLAKALRTAGFDIWWDADLPAHRAYSEVIERNLSEAKAVIVLWSKSATQSQWVRAEADYARNAGKLVQARVDRSIPPIPFNQFQCAELGGWRGGTSQAGWAKLQASVQTLVGGEQRVAVSPAKAGSLDLLHSYRWLIAAVLAVVVASAILWWALAPSGEERRPVLAVLPFTSLDERDSSLVAGIWEDTRNAIGRNPQLVVLGPNTAEQLAKKGEDATRRASDYVLQASVRTLGDRIRVSTGLVRSKDGTQLWTQNFDRKLDDVFELQSEIASEIEGRIRGRLAQAGGVRPENIATSGSVYALYSDARAKIRKRDSQLYLPASKQLEQVVRLDPNFAPAWASLAIVYGMIPPDQIDFNPYDRAQRYARKAIELAPNLAAGHAALAFSLDGGPLVRAEIERAVQLDPNDFEAVNWLGNSFNFEGQKKEALAAYTRAAEIEPLFWPAVLNKLLVLLGLHDDAGIQQLVEQERQLGADHLVLAIKMFSAAAKGDLGEEANMGLAYWRSGREEGRAAIREELSTTLLTLGYADQAYKISPVPAFAPYLWRDDPKGLDMLEALHIPPRKFFSMYPFLQNAGRVYVLSGRGKQLADMYLSLKGSPEEFSRLSGGGFSFILIAPTVAVALRQNRHEDQAEQLLAKAESIGTVWLKGGFPNSPGVLARVYAAEGKKEEALSSLTAAVNDNWIPWPPLMPMDLALDPPFASLKGDLRFEQLRQRILGAVQRERSQVRTADLAAVNADTR